MDKSRIFNLDIISRNYQTSTQGIWWMELAKDLDSPRDIICPSKTDDSNVFAMRILTVEGRKQFAAFVCNN